MTRKSAIRRKHGFFRMRADRRFGVKTFRIEFQIALLALVIAAAVITAEK